MSTKIKAPPKKTGNDLLASLKLTKNKSTTGYAAKLSSLFNFLLLTADIRTGAEVVEENINIDQGGRILSHEELRRDFIGDKMSKVKFLVKEENDLQNKISEFYREKSDLYKIIRSKAKVNTDEKKEKAQKRIDELEEPRQQAQTALNELRSKIEELKAAERKKLEATEFTIKEMREKFELLTGSKIKIELETGSYSFIVPVGNSFYQEVCTLLDLPLENQEPVAKPVIKRMFKMPPEVLDAIKKAMKFVSTDDLRPAMTAVCLDIIDNKLLVVATDAHRLFKSREFDVSGPPGTFTYLLPISALKRLPKATSEDLNLYELKDGQVSLMNLAFTPIDAKYPNWRVVVPEYSIGVTFEKDNFISCVKQVIPFSNKSTSQVNININGMLLFAAQDVDFSFEGGIRCRYLKKDMPDTTIGFNGKFLVEAMGSFKSEEIRMLSEGASTKAAIFTDGVDEVLIMPLMLSQ